MMSILYQEYAQVYQTQQPEDSNCGEINPIVNSIPFLLVLTHPIHYCNGPACVLFVAESQKPHTGKQIASIYLGGTIKSTPPRDLYVLLPSSAT